MSKVLCDCGCGKLLNRRTALRHRIGQSAPHVRATYIYSKSCFTLNSDLREDQPTPSEEPNEPSIDFPEPTTGDDISLEGMAAEDSVSSAEPSEELPHVLTRACNSARALWMQRAPAEDEVSSDEESDDNDQMESDEECSGDESLSEYSGDEQDGVLSGWDQLGEEFEGRYQPDCTCQTCYTLTVRLNMFVQFPS